MIKFDRLTKIMIILFFALHFIDFSSTMYVIHINNPHGVFEEKNIFVKHIVESSPLWFTILFVLTIGYFVLLFHLFSWLERKSGRPIIKFVLVLLIIIKVAVLINNFYSIYKFYVWMRQ